MDKTTNTYKYARMCKEHRDMYGLSYYLLKKYQKCVHPKHKGKHRDLTGLRSVTLYTFLNSSNSITIGDRICTSCRKNLLKLSDDATKNQSESERSEKDVDTGENDGRDVDTGDEAEQNQFESGSTEPIHQNENSNSSDESCGIENVRGNEDKKKEDLRSAWSTAE